jgi:hypothetical protein
MTTDSKYLVICVAVVVRSFMRLDNMAELLSKPVFLVQSGGVF